MMKKVVIMEFYVIISIQKQCNCIVSFLEELKFHRVGVNLSGAEDSLGKRGLMQKVWEVLGLKTESPMLRISCPTLASQALSGKEVSCVKLDPWLITAYQHSSPVILHLCNWPDQMRKRSGDNEIVVEAWIGGVCSAWHLQDHLSQTFWLTVVKRSSTHRKELPRGNQLCINWSVPSCPGLNGVVVQGLTASLMSTQVEVGVVRHVQRRRHACHPLHQDVQG